jgi:Arc/MetJ-type ribon-helix-helix transcriptional regulator
MKPTFTKKQLREQVFGRPARKRSPDSQQRVVRAKPTLKDLVASAHAVGVKVTCHLEPILHVEVSQGMEADLNTLVRSGLFGVNASEAARRILEEWLWNNTMRIAALRPNGTSSPTPDQKTL